jgi:hypothetical protein
MKNQAILLSIGILSTVIIQSPSLAGSVHVLPVQVCNDAGIDCANPAKELYASITNKIWSQAGISINFSSWDKWNSSANQNILGLPETSPAAFFASAPPHALKSTIPNSITMWFAKSMQDGTFGDTSAIGGDKIVILDNVFTTSRLDTIAHEIGHSLGLRHEDPGMDQTYLMQSPGRTIPSMIGDINPDGLKLSKLTSEQKIIAASSPSVKVPAPLPILGFYAMFNVRKRLKNLSTSLRIK